MLRVCVEAPRFAQNVSQRAGFHQPVLEIFCQFQLSIGQHPHWSSIGDAFLSDTVKVGNESVSFLQVQFPAVSSNFASKFPGWSHSCIVTHDQRPTAIFLAMSQKTMDVEEAIVPHRNQLGTNRRLGII